MPHVQGGPCADKEPGAAQDRLIGPAVETPVHLGLLLGLPRNIAVEIKPAKGSRPADCAWAIIVSSLPSHRVISRCLPRRLPCRAETHHIDRAVEIFVDFVELPRGPAFQKDIGFRSHPSSHRERGIMLQPVPCVDVAKTGPITRPGVRADEFPADGLEPRAHERLTGKLDFSSIARVKELVRLSYAGRRCRPSIIVPIS